ncbi:MAG: hypothetical protein ACREFR_14765 [Limisphaerales bacterium]
MKIGAIDSPACQLLINDVAIQGNYISMRTELIWDFKYEDEAKTKRRAPLRIALPFQTVETVNESAADRNPAFRR